MTNNAYIHIPFCRSKCKYCSFISYPKLGLKEQYLKALKSQIAQKYLGEKLNTLYFGGGTPSILSSKEISQIIKLFNTCSETEITIELNPEGITEKYLTELKLGGINRLSFGCQTFDDKILLEIGRRHKSIDVIEAINFAKICGFKNISLDLIYGLPNQTQQGFERDLQKAISLGIQHISLYGLKIEDDCFYAANPPKNLPDQDLQADMYLRAIEIAKNNGFEHYEISNFAQKGFESKHNLNYWNNNTYYGFGVGAHGYENDIRYYNTNSIEEYIKNPIEYSHKLSLKEQLEEEIFLGFRKSEGIDISKINSKYNIDFNKNYKFIIDRYSDYIEKTAKGYRLNNSGFLISNIILSEFL